MPHIHEKIDFCAEVFIVYKDKVLLRMHDKFKIWLSIGGHIELDEDPVEAAIREVKEEVGLDINIRENTVRLKQDEVGNQGYRYLIPPRYMGRHPVNENHEHIVLVYFATSDSGTVAESANEHERTETLWATREDLDKMELLPNIKFYATEALKELGE